MLHVNVGGLDFFGHKGPFGIEPDGFTGWDEGVATRTTSTARESANGAYALPVYLEQRFVTLKGNVIGRNPADLAFLRTRLTGVLNDGKPGKMVVQRPWGAQWATCYLDGQPRFSERGGTHTGTFEINFRFPDPRKFGHVNSFVARVNAPAGVQHFGNHPATPFMRVTGNAPGGYRITLGGYSVQVNRELGASYPHEIDYWTGRLRVNDKFVTGDMSSAVFAPVDPGQRDTLSIQPLTSGAPVVTMTLPDTFI